MTILPRRHLAFALLSALFLTLCAGGAFVYHNRKPDVIVCEHTTTTIMKARVDLHAGDVLTPDKVTWDDLPTRFLPPNYFGEADAPSAFGSVLTVRVERGSMVLSSDLAEPGTPRPVDPSGGPAIPTPEEIMPETEL
jgi:Flp pilus assembly protein CpaB